jgi:hypothetical protein
MHKVFQMLVPSGGVISSRSEAADFQAAWDGHAVDLADLARTSDGFRFYTRTPRTEALTQLPYPGDPRYIYDGVDTFGFDTLADATGFRDAARRLCGSPFAEASAWLVAEEHVHMNGAPQGRLDTGPGIHVITSMRRRQELTIADYRRYQGDHAQLVASTQGISRYAVNLIVDAEYAAGRPPVDGVAEVWFRTPGDMEACFRDPSMTGIQQVHNRLFIDTSTFFTLQCRNAEQWVLGARTSVPEQVQ